MSKVKIYNNDCRSLSEFVKEKIDFIVFSPPYWNLRDYKEKNQIGKFQSYEEYISSMKETFEECYKVLQEGRFMAINIGTEDIQGGHVVKKKSRITYFPASK